jgi:hypothetical protein
MVSDRFSRWLANRPCSKARITESRFQSLMLLREDFREGDRIERARFRSLGDPELTAEMREMLSAA